MLTIDELKQLVRQVPNFPKAGINFYDITTLLNNPAALHTIIDLLFQRYQPHNIDHVIGIEARGFIFASPLAYLFNASFVPVRKPNKLPAATLSATYDLEYGQNKLEMHIDAIKPGESVLIIDDLLATGGTAAATIRMVESVGGHVVGLGSVIELTTLNGRQKLADYEVYSLLAY